MKLMSSVLVIVTYFGLLIIVGVSAWWRVIVNRKKCRAASRLSPDEKLARQYNQLIDVGRSDVILANIRNPDLGQSLPQISDSDCPSQTKELFWILIAVLITLVCLALGLYGYRKWSYEIDPLDQCAINILECDDVAKYCANPQLENDRKQCNEFCQRLDPYDSQCIPQHCDVEIANAMLLGLPLNEQTGIVLNCQSSCIERNKEGIASSQCQALLCSLPVEEGKPDPYAATCEAFCANRNSRYELYCINRTCNGDNNDNGACACVAFLDSGGNEDLQICQDYCVHNPSDELCTEVYCFLQPIQGCLETCSSTTVPNCAPFEITGTPIQLYQTILRQWVDQTLHLTEIQAPNMSIIMTGNFYALRVGDQYVGIDIRSRRAILTHSDPVLFRVFSSGRRYVFTLMTDPVRIAGNQYANLFLGWNRRNCAAGIPYLSWVTQPINSRMADVEWWIASENESPILIK